MSVMNDDSCAHIAAFHSRCKIEYLLDEKWCRQQIAKELAKCAMMLTEYQC